MRRHGNFAVTVTLTEEECADQARDTSVDVYNGAAGEVEGAPLPQHARSCVQFSNYVWARVGIRTGPPPDHVRHRQVREGEPQYREDQYGGELHALCVTASDEAYGDCSEGQL